MKGPDQGGSATILTTIPTPFWHISDAESSEGFLVLQMPLVLLMSAVSVLPALAYSVFEYLLAEREPSLPVLYSSKMPILSSEKLSKMAICTPLGQYLAAMFLLDYEALQLLTGSVCSVLKDMISPQAPLF